MLRELLLQTNDTRLSKDGKRIEWRYLYWRMSKTSQRSYTTSINTGNKVDAFNVTRIKRLKLCV